MPFPAFFSVVDVCSVYLLNLFPYDCMVKATLLESVEVKGHVHIKF